MLILIAVYSVTILAELGDNGDEAVIEEARRRFELYTTAGDATSLPTNLRSFAFNLVYSS